MSNSILAAVRRVPAALPALDDGARRLTFGDLNRLVEQERRWLNSFMVRRCALLAQNSCSWVLSDLSLMASNAMHAPIPLTLSVRQEKELLDNVSVDFVLTDNPEHFRGSEHGFSTIGCSHRTGFTLLRRDAVLRRRSTDCFAKILHTPLQSTASQSMALNLREIELEAKSLMNAAAQHGVTRHMCVLPLSTLLENIAGVYVPLMLGAQVIVRPPHTFGVDESAVDVHQLLQALQVEQPESLALLPQLLQLLVDAVGQGWRVPSSLKFIAVGEGACLDLLRAARRSGLPVFAGDRLTPTQDYLTLRAYSYNKVDAEARMAVSI